MNEQEIQDVLDELNEVRPEVLNNKAKRLFKAIMKIADDRDKANKRVDELINEVTLKDSELEKKDKKLASQEKEIKLLKEFHNKNVRIIDLMANNIADSSNVYENLVNTEFEHTKEEVIEYFTKKAEENNG